MQYHHASISMAELQKYWLTVLIVGKDVQQQNSYSLLVEVQNGTATMEDNTAVSYKAKHMIEFSNCILRHCPIELKLIFTQNQQAKVYRSLIYN